MVHRKGQISFDFYVSLILFLGFLGYITFQLFQIVPTTINTARIENVRIEAYQISELLINDGGHPLDWETRPLTEIKRLGLSDVSKNVTNLLSSSKFFRFNSICATNYNDVKRLLDVKEEFSITFINHTANSQWSCKSPTPTNKRISFNISRAVTVGNDLGEILVEVWRI